MIPLAHEMFAIPGSFLPTLDTKNENEIGPMTMKVEFVNHKTTLKYGSKMF
jgi:hypothetical protein